MPKLRRRHAALVTAALSPGSYSGYAAPPPRPAMSVVRRTVSCAAPVADVQERWYDVARWPSWVDGFGALVERDERWPSAGGRLVWQSTPHGRGRVIERVSEHVDGVGYEAGVSDDQLQGTQRVSFHHDGDHSQVTLELEYALRRSRPGWFVIDLLFIRRALGDSLERTLEAFSAELSRSA